MEQLITCKICFENKNTNIILEHINPTGNVSEHQMCNDCYKIMTKPECPFCRCEIILPKSKEISTNANRNITNRNITNRNISYNVNRILAGLNGWDGLPLSYSN
jgi:hypothetical protein